MHFPHSFVILTGIWSECNRSEDSIDIKKSDSPPVPIWTPKSAPQSPTVERRFRPVPFESPTLSRKKLPANGTTPPPWTQPNYPDKPYQPTITKSSSWNAIGTPKFQASHIIYRKARGKRPDNHFTPARSLIALPYFPAADQINERVEKSLQNSSSQKEKSISFKAQPLSPVKSNELGETSLSKLTIIPLKPSFVSFSLLH